jgi:hypothetical protein
MNDNRKFRVCTRVALAVAAVLPLASACGGNSNPPPNTGATAGTATMGGQPPPPAYAGAPPPGYPGTPPPAYPGVAPTAYPPGQIPQAQPQQYPPAPQPTYATPGPQAPGAQPAPSGTQPPPGPLAPTDPNSLQGILQGIQTAIQGTVVPGGAVSGDLVDAGLKLHAARVAPGMQPEGDELKQTLNEGQHAVMMVTLQAGKCYSIVGFSPPGAVKDLDLNLLAPPLYMTLAGQDLTHNNTPAIGAAPNAMCPVIAFPLQYKLDVVAKSGAGQVAVQLYSKNKK